MAKKDIQEEIKKLVIDNKLIIGTDRTLKHIKSGKAKKVFISSNCPANIKEDVNHYSKISGFEVVELSESNNEVGDLCKKPFPISVFCI